MIESIRKRYDKLTPLERSRMQILESVGQRREAQAVALESPSLHDAFLTECCRGDTTMIAGLAMFWAMRAELFGATVCRNDSEGAAKLHAIALGWIVALHRLEQETGAAFFAASRFFDKDLASDLLAEAQTYDTLDASRQHETLAEVWKAASAYAQ